MATASSPYGLVPIRRADGLPYAGATTEYQIASAYGTNIYTGSIVIMTAAGTIAISTATGADITTNNFGGNPMGALGVFMGCEYVNTEGQVVHSNYFPTGTVNGGNTISAKVCDDPHMLFQAQMATGGGALTIVGNNAILNAVQSTSTGSTATGKSNTALSSTTQTTVAGLRVVQHVSPLTDDFVDVLVRFTAEGHTYTQSSSVGI